MITRELFAILPGWSLNSTAHQIPPTIIAATRRQPVARAAPGGFRSAMMAESASYASAPTEDEEVKKPFLMTAEGNAIVGVTGVMSKHPGLFRSLGLSDRRTSREIGAQLAAAVVDPEVRSILLFVDSPGGTVDGTYELAEAVREADTVKPVHAFIEDVGASAAYWVASQARKVTTNATGRVGSIGVYSVLADSSEAASRAGVKFHLISTGQHKGAGHPGLPFTAAQLSAHREEIADVNAVFLDAVASGRGMPMSRLRTIADGRCFVGKRAVQHGLVDSVGTLSEALRAAPGRSLLTTSASEVGSALAERIEQQVTARVDLLLSGLSGPDQLN